MNSPRHTPLNASGIERTVDVEESAPLIQRQAVSGGNIDDSAPTGSRLQQDSQPSAPNAENGDANGAHRTCRRCAREGRVSVVADQEADQCPRCRSVLPRNQLARVDGTRARYQPPDIRMTQDEFLSGLVSDLGGEANLTTLEAAYVRRLVDIDVTIRLLTHHLAVNGLVTPGGKVRDSYDKLLAGCAVFDRLAQRLGTERRQRPVSSFADAVRDAK